MALPSLRRAAGLPHHRIAAVALLAGCSCLGLGVGRLGWSADFAAAATAASAAAAPTPAEVTPQAGVAPAAPAPAPSAGVGGQAAPPAAAGQALPAGAPRILHRVVFGEGGWCALSFRRIRAAFHEIGATPAGRSGSGAQTRSRRSFSGRAAPWIGYCSCGAATSQSISGA
ncbi:unnamed protein product [Prorocentrum cordatum]|uniref:Uncharacterized protein n=1 Tax=Prorocentrum cordatum TaxID=2364126 RepID=A0ABN9XQL2_9DINO|nr:unnamed protein product [Polarella glacialis]